MISSKEDILYTSKLFDYFTVRIYSFLANFLPNKLIKKLPTFYFGSFGSYQVWNLEQVIKYMKVSITSSVKWGCQHLPCSLPRLVLESPWTLFFHCPHLFYLQNGSSDCEHLSIHPTMSPIHDPQPPADSFYQNTTTCSFPFWSPSTAPHPSPVKLDPNSLA